LPRRLGWSKQVALIGHNDDMAGVAGILAKEHPFYHVNTIAYRDDPGLPSKDDTLTRFRRYFEEVTSLGIFDVFVVNSPDISSCSRELIMAADSKCVHLNFVTAPAEMMPYSSKDGVLTVELPVLRSHDESLSTMENRIKKRIVDLVISTFVIVFILSWLIPIIGLIIKIQSPGPIFFKQPRSGRNNQTFDCYKFRSMVVNTESNAKQAVKGDKRITAIGQFLRKTNLDEFPQFINVFLGQMSVVGPRPHMLAHTEHYSQLIQHYMVRHFVKPGITGWAQVNGCRGETKDPGAMAKRVEYDLDYMNNWSAMLDFKIVCMTVLNMLQGEKNAY
jgi:exopolysaccharide biosynthesis polyprenyl glycosylphosphotransferase